MKGINVEHITQGADEIVIHVLPSGFIIKIEGIPFEVVNDCEIKGNKRNFIAAGLRADEKEE